MFQIINQTKERIPKKSLEKLCNSLVQSMKNHGHLNKLLKLRGIKPSEPLLIIAFVNEKKGKDLNKKFRKKDRATDVLSFEPAAPLTLGELVLCLPVLKRQAKDHGLTIQQEMGYLIIHGFLHLLGFEHETNKRDERKMMSLQDRLFEKLV